MKTQSREARPAGSVSPKEKTAVSSSSSVSIDASTLRPSANVATTDAISSSAALSVMRSVASNTSISMLTAPSNANASRSGARSMA